MPTYLTPAVVQYKTFTLSGQGASIALPVFDDNTAAGNTILVIGEAIQDGTGDVVVINSASDTGSNSYGSPMGVQGSGGYGLNTVAIMSNGIGGGNKPTVTLAVNRSSAVKISGVIMEIEGVPASAALEMSPLTGTNNGGTSISTSASGTLSQPAAIAIGCAGGYFGVPDNVTGWTTLLAHQNGSGGFLGSVVAWLAVAATTSLTFTATHSSGAGDKTAMMVILKAAEVSGGGGGSSSLVPVISGGHQLTSTEYRRLAGPGLNVLATLANLDVGTVGTDNIAAFRFRATRSGTVSSIRSYLMGYGGGYSGGNGGTIRARIFPDNGSLRPNMAATAIASGQRAMNLDGSGLFQGSDGPYDPITFTSGARTLTEGTIYHVVYDQLDASPATNRTGVNSIATTLSREQPDRWAKLDDKAVLFGYRTAGSSGAYTWEDFTVDGNAGAGIRYSPIFQILLADGKTIGHGAVFTGEVVTGSSIDRTYTIDSTHPIRLRYTPSSNRSLLGFSIMTAASVGGNLSVALKQGTTTLKSDSIAQASANYATYSFSGLTNADLTWYDVEFDSPASLTSGTQYDLELTPAGSSEWKAIADAYSYAYAGDTVPTGFVSQRYTGSAWESPDPGAHTTPDPNAHWRIVLHFAAESGGGSGGGSGGTVARTLAQEWPVCMSALNDFDPGLLLPGYDGDNSWPSNPDFPTRPYGPNIEPAKDRNAVMPAGVNAIDLWLWAMPRRFQLVSQGNWRFEFGYCQSAVKLDNLSAAYQYLTIDQPGVGGPYGTYDVETGTSTPLPGVCGRRLDGTLIEGYGGILETQYNTIGNDRATRAYPRTESAQSISLVNVGMTTGRYVYEGLNFGDLGVADSTRVKALVAVVWARLIKDDPNGPDNLDAVEFGGLLGIDLYGAGGRLSGDSGTISSGRLIRFTRGWRPVVIACVKNDSGVMLTKQALSDWVAANPPSFYAPSSEAASGTVLQSLSAARDITGQGATFDLTLTGTVPAGAISQMRYCKTADVAVGPWTVFYNAPAVEGTVTGVMNSGDVSTAYTVRSDVYIPPVPTLVGDPQVDEATFTTTDGTGTAPSITTDSLPSGTSGTAYSQTLYATGTATITWSKPSGTLPTGLSLSSSGVLSGTPTTPGSFTFTVRATNSIGTADREFTVVIAAAASGPTISTSVIPTGTVSSAYPSTTFAASGGSTPYTWAIDGLPPGMSFTSGGVLSGTPTLAGAFQLSVTVTDAASAQYTRGYVLTVNPAGAAVSSPWASKVAGL